jgi:hypothetical protein
VNARADVTSVIASAIQRNAALDVTADTEDPRPERIGDVHYRVWGSD